MNNNNHERRISKRKDDEKVIINNGRYAVIIHAPKPKPLGFDGIGFDQYWI